MTTTEAFFEGEDSNFIINFGPQHPTAHSDSEVSLWQVVIAK